MIKKNEWSDDASAETAATENLVKNGSNIKERKNYTCTLSDLVSDGVCANSKGHHTHKHSILDLSLLVTSGSLLMIFRPLTLWSEGIYTIPWVGPPDSGPASVRGPWTRSGSCVVH